MDITGLTGNSGCGKTTVAQLMSNEGFYHINCDQIVHNKVYTDKAVLDKIVQAFGEEYLQNGVLNRRKLGALIFSDKNAYDTLMKLVKDDIINAVEKEIIQNADRHILLDAPTLFEFGMQNKCNRIVAVISDKAVERICERDGISKAEAKQRLSNQKSESFFRENCEIVIENNGDFAMLTKTVKNVAAQILKG